MRYKTKKPRLIVETALIFKSTIMKRWFPPFGFHSHSFMQVSSAISFRLPPASISAAASSGSPLSCDFSGLPLSRPIAASASLSDPRCFRSLSVASVLGSDYSASVSSFPCFLSPPHSGFLSAPLSLSLLRSSPFSPAWFPVHSLPVPVLSFAVCFLSPFPDSLPRPFLRCLPPLSLLAFSVPDPTPFRSLTLPFRLLSLLLLPFCPLDLSPHSWLFVQARFLTSPLLFPVFHGWFPVRFLPVLHTQFSVRFLSSFPASLPQPFHRCFPFGFLLRDRCLTSACLSSASAVASHYSASVSSFPLIFPSPPHSWLPRCFCSALASQILPLTPGLVSHAIFPVPCTRLPVCFLSSFPASLPQPFHWCFPFRFPLRDQRLTSAPFRSLPF